MTQPETRLVGKILKELRKHGGFWFKVHGSAYQASGIPDIIGCYQGRFIGMEVKLPETASDASLRQRLMLKRIASAGGIPRIVTSTQDALEVVHLIDRSLERQGEQ